MQHMNLNRPLKAKAIYIKGNNKPLRDKYVFIVGSFLIVGQNENDTAPTWYNVDQIKRLEGVEALPTEAKRQQVFF